jgi:hypothetical protein
MMVKTARWASVVALTEPEGELSREKERRNCLEDRIEKVTREQVSSVSRRKRKMLKSNPTRRRNSHIDQLGSWTKRHKKFQFPIVSFSFQVSRNPETNI